MRLSIYIGGHWPTILQAVTVPVVSNSVCERMFLAAGYVKKIPDTFICAGTEKGGFDACKVSIICFPFTLKIVLFKPIN